MNQEDLIQAIRNSLPDEASQELFDRAVASRKQGVASRKFIIATLGIQGAGKSSLLNALVVGDDVLPVEADETTCIPVEIHNCVERDPYCIVQYKDGQIEQVAVEREALNRLVNHEFNPNNQLEINHIELHIHSPLLRPDVVFVDLPGVASLSTANQETTMKYIMSCSAAIFLLRTVPPITRIESMFLRAVWPQLSNAYFVQNWWENETDRELEGGMVHNHDVLSKISEQIGVQFDKRIIPIQIKDAVLGTYAGDGTLRERSGIPVLEDTIERGFHSWAEDIIRDNAVWLGLKIAESIRFNELLMKDLEKNTANAKSELEQQQEVFQKERDTINTRFDELKLHSEGLSLSIRKHMSTFIDKLEEMSLQAINEKISAGIMDGHYFETIVKEQLQGAQLTIVNELQYQIQEATKKIVDDFESILQQLNESRPGIEFDVNSTDSFKYERSFPAVASLGFMAAAPVLLALLVSNPAGWMVAGALTVAGLIGSLLGYSAKSAIENKRKAAAIKSAKSIVAELMDELRNLVKQETKNYLSRLIQELEKLLVSELNRIEAEFGIRRDVIHRNMQDHDSLVRDTGLALDILKNGKDDIESLALNSQGEAVS